MTTMIDPRRAKCDNRACPSSEECLRYRAPAATFQQRWCMFRPKDGEIACDAFIRYEVTCTLRTQEGAPHPPVGAGQHR